MAPEALSETRTLPRGSISSSPLYLLVVEDGSSFVSDLPREGVVVIGRDPDVAVQLRNDAASRRHARITLRDGKAEVEDLGSRNGTWLNGEPLTAPRPFSSGDVVAVGEAQLVLHARPAGGARPGLLDGEAVQERLVTELERAARYERPVAVAWLSVRQGDRPVAASALPYLRPIDVAGAAEDGALLAVLPELRPDEAEAMVGRLALLLGRQGLTVRGGVAGCPADATDAETLLAMARAAAAAAEPGKVSPAAAGSRRLELGDRTVLLADPAMIRIYDLIRRLAGSPLPVLVSGETGTGKENAAYAIHHFSPRAAGPFVAINCAALPESLAESELFGHEKGAFTGAATARAGRIEAAHGGTLFLDELGELPLSIQAKLLRVLEDKKVQRVGAAAERPVDVRIVAATNRRLEVEVAAGRFRQDLYFRLNAAVVVLPPLRDRPREIALLARAFLAGALGEGRPVPELSAGAMRALARYPWPGNVRELRNTMEFLAATATDDVPGAALEAWQLPDKITGEAQEGGEPASPATPVRTPATVPPVDGGGDEAQADPAARPAFRPITEELRALERRRMEEALAAAGGNQTRAAALISMPLRTFVLKLKQYGIAARKA